MFYNMIMSREDLSGSGLGGIFALIRAGSWEKEERSYATWQLNERFQRRVKEKAPQKGL